MAKLFVEDLALNNGLKGKRVLVRVDFNVPVKDGVVESDKRLRESLPTLNYVLAQGGSLVLMSHLGRPDGKRVEKHSLKPVAARLQELLGRPVKFLDDCVGAAVEQACAAIQPGEVILLENLRFHLAEEGKVKAKDGSVTKATPEEIAAFRASLTKLGDVFVNDAFGTAHRAHSSVVGVDLPRASGYLLKKELDFLGGALDEPKRPFVSIIGGAKISGKIDVIMALLPKVDTLIIGGGMAYTFLKAQGHEIGKSLVENDKVDLAKSLLAEAGNKIQLPIDFMVTDSLDFGARKIGSPLQAVSASGIPADQESVDIGPESAKLFGSIITNAKTVVWNGPMGVFEIEACAQGTYSVAKSLVEATTKGAITIIGGGDSAAAIEQMGLEKQVSHVSTGGGASLEFLEGKALPGVTALSDK
jgi:phosphoglycerate kinase